MTQRRKSRGRDFTLTAAFALAVVLSSGSARAQSGQQISESPPPAAAPATPPATAAVPPTAPAVTSPTPPAVTSPPKKDGFFDAVERWWDQSQAELKAGFEKMKGQIDALNADSAKATKEATDALVKLPNTRIIEGEEVCALAPNGSPDCQGAADTICRSKGFAGGKTANVEVTRKCSARALLSRSEEDCTNEAIVTKAACQ